MQQAFLHTYLTVIMFVTGTQDYNPLLERDPLSLRCAVETHPTDQHISPHCRFVFSCVSLNLLREVTWRFVKLLNDFIKLLLSS